jgi:hypothetical protein
VIGVVYVIVAVIAFALGRGTSPRPDQAVGTIAGVEKAVRHRTPQITEGDVVLRDADRYAVLQNDRFMRLINDDAFRRAIQNKEFRSFIEAENQWWLRWRGGWMREISESKDFKVLMESKNFRSWFFDDPAFREALVSDAMREVMEAPDGWRAFTEDARMTKRFKALRTLMENEPDFRRAFFSDPVREFFTSDNFLQMIKMEDRWWSVSWLIWRGGWLREIGESKDFRRLMEDSKFRRWFFEDPAFREALASDAMRQMMEAPDGWRAFTEDARMTKRFKALRTLLENEPDFRRAFFSPPAREFFTSDDYRRMIKMEDRWWETSWLIWRGGWLREIGESTDFKVLMENKDFRSWFEDPAFREALASDAMRQVMEAPDAWRAFTEDARMTKRFKALRTLLENEPDFRRAFFSPPAREFFAGDDYLRMIKMEDAWWLYWRGGWYRQPGEMASLSAEDLRRLNVEDEWWSHAWLIWRGGWYRELAESGAVSAEDLRRIANIENEWWLRWRGGW